MTIGITSDNWGPLYSKYATPRPRRILSLDGGGIRGVLTLEILREIERQLAEISGRGTSFRLSDFFDYIGGTSTGAIIAAGLARGMSVGELADFYRASGRDMFDKQVLWRRHLSAYKSDSLEAELKEVFGATTDLSPEYLKCLLLVVTRNATTDSPWPLSSNPSAKYNSPSRPDCNLRIPLWKLVRASTAAPTYFPPEVVNWDPEDSNKSFVFQDGGVTPYNNPAFLLFRMATLPEYRLGWERGEGKLMIVSVGTGSSASSGPTVESPDQNLLAVGLTIPGVLMNGMAIDQDVSCRSVGRCVYGATIDREVGDLVPRNGTSPIPLAEDLGRAFLYARFDADLSPQGLASLGLGSLNAEKLQKLDAVDAIDDLATVGRAVAKHVFMKDFGTLVEG